MERKNFSSLAAVIDQYLHWFGQWHRAVLFPDIAISGSMAPPESLEDMQGFQHLQQYMKLPVFTRLKELHQLLCQRTRQLQADSKLGKQLTYSDFNLAWTTFEALTSQLRRIEQALGALEVGLLDPLTGLKIPSQLMEMIEKEMERFRATGIGFVVALADVDHLDKLNNSHSRDAGDFVLAEVAGRIGHNLRPHDDVYRLQDDEFLIVLKRTNLENGLLALERTKRKIAVLPVTLPGVGDISVTASFGAASPSYDETAETLMGRVRLSLIESRQAAKATG